MTSLPGFAKRLDRIAPSATVAVSQRAEELKRQGVDMLSFSMGEPDFPTPPHIIEAAKQALDKGATRYTNARGIIELREAICEVSAQRRGGQRHRPEEVVVSVGAKHALFNLAVALFETGDEVIIPAPYWVSYPEHVRLFNANPVIVETREEDGFLMRPDQLEKAISSKTKALVLCTPSNPCGSAYSEAQLRALADVARKHSFWIVVDEIYGELVYGDFKQKSILEVAPDLRDRIVIIDGVSKTYAMTGWRIGWMIGSEKLAKACDKVQGQATTNPAAVAQYAALAALKGPREPIETMRKAFEERRTLIVDGLNQIPGFRCLLPEGAFYAFPNVSALIGKRAKGVVLENDLALATYLIEEARCAVVPGSAFGAPGYLRLSYATSNAVIKEGLQRIRTAVEALV